MGCTSIKKAFIYLKNTSCFSVVLIKDLSDGVPSDLVHDLITELTTKIYEIIGDEEACNLMDEVQATLVRDIADLIIGIWEREVFSQSSP